LEVWKNAANELRDTKYIIIIGYSLPDSDSFFKYLLALGMLSKTQIRKIIVINPDKSTERKYRDILAKGLEERFKFYPDLCNKTFDILSKEIIV